MTEATTKETEIRMTDGTGQKPANRVLTVRIGQCLAHRVRVAAAEGDVSMNEWLKIAIREKLSLDGAALAERNFQEGN